MKIVFQKLLFPNKIIAIPLCLLSTILLVYVFSIHLEGTFLSYIAYLLSAYSLIIFIVWFCKACKFSADFIKRTKIYHFYDKHSSFIMKTTLLISSIINLMYGIFKLSTGIYYKSWWFISFAIYYLILWLMKILLVKDTKHFGDNINKELKKMKNTGIILFTLNIVFIGIIILIMSKNHYFYYPGYLIYGVALYDFYLIITAIVNVVKHSNSKSPIITASKCISLTVAMISILSLEVAMIYQFGNNEQNFKRIMVACTGFGITFINTIMSLIMIYKGKRKNK